MNLGLYEDNILYLLNTGLFWVLAKLFVSKNLTWLFELFDKFSDFSYLLFLSYLSESLLFRWGLS
jgi:hypothetical protein